MKTIRLKFVDLMVGIVLGAGFLWVTNFHQPWQYLAFLFVYLDILDYWLDHSSAQAKFPSKRIFDLVLTILTVLAIFSYTFTIQFGLWPLLLAFGLFKFFDFIWLIRVEKQHRPHGEEKMFVNSWIICDILEVGFALAMIILLLQISIQPMTLLIIFIIFRVLVWLLATQSHKKLFLN